MKKSYCQWEAGLIDDFIRNIYPYHFVRAILSIPFCPMPFCPYTILSIPFCPYHFVRYHFVLEPYYSSFCDSVAAVSAGVFFIKRILFCIIIQTIFSLYLGLNSLLANKVIAI